MLERTGESMTSLLAFILIGLMAALAATLLFEKDRFFSIRYLLTGIALSTLAGMLVTLFSRGTSGFAIVTPGAVIASLVAAVGGVLLLKLASRPLNKKTDADIPWDAKNPEQSRQKQDKDQKKDDDEDEDNDSDNDHQSNQKKD